MHSASETTTDALGRLLASRPWLLGDGGMGTGLLARGLPVGTAPERWNLDYPSRVADLHREFLDAGADLILSNSFGGNRRRLALMGEARIEAIDTLAARIAVETRDACSSHAVVAGSMGPTGALLAPLGPLAVADAEAMFAEQAQALAAGDVDCLWIETMASVEEMRAAVAGAATTGLPLVCTFSFDSRGHTMMGVDAAAAARAIRELPVRPQLVGANCGDGALEALAVIDALHRELGDDYPLVAKANCGQPQYIDGEIHYGHPPALMAEYARLARDAGARVVGGCCGTTAAHLIAMRDALQAHRPRPFDADAARAALTGASAAG